MHPHNGDMGLHEYTAAPPLLVATQVWREERRTQQRRARVGERHIAAEYDEGVS